MAIDVLKTGALVIVGVGGIFCIYRGDVSVGAALLGSLLGYVFGNAHGMIAYRERLKGS